MITRRTFLGSVGAAIAASPFVSAAPANSRRLKMAVLTTEWRYHSHAWHMAERFLAGYPINGHWHHPPIDVVSAYVDQFPENDLSREREQQFGFKIYPTVAEAVRNGGDKLAVDAVLLIGEHGDYPDNEFGQKKYPRYELFKQAADVFREDGRSVPIFNDKHLSWNWDWAKEMVALSHELKFPFLAGSSLPMTWRMPSIDMPMGAEVEEIMSVAIGSVDSYDFHALEVLQCMAERRQGGETGVVSMQALRGDAVWDAMKAGSWSDGGWNPQLFEACLCRSQTLAQGDTYSHRYPTEEQIREWVKEPVLYRYEHADGLKASMLLMNGLVSDFTFAAKLKGKDDPLSTLFYLPPNPNVVYSAALMSKAEDMFLTGKAPYPIERTLLTTGLVAAGMESLASEQSKLATPHLDVQYQPPAKSQFWQT
ncbi:MAG: hypothetical protein KDA52_13230 [Planctomycetaceae bacterium]|nr:hypothetical protein [Planctomycetaceae bacterium]